MKKTLEPSTVHILGNKVGSDNTMYCNQAFGCSKNINIKSKPDCFRLIFSDSQNLPLTSLVNNKYCEFVFFNNAGKNGFAVCIGFNPKLGEKNKFDRSNQKLANYLISKKYSGYILVNFYTLLSKSANGINNISNTVKADVLGIASFFVNNTNFPIFLCYGKTKSENILSTNLGYSLNYAKKNKRKIFISIDKNGNFIHVGVKKCGNKYMPSFIVYNSKKHGVIF